MIKLMRYNGMGTLSRPNWNLEMLVFEERGKPEYPERKTPRSKDESFGYKMIDS